MSVRGSAYEPQECGFQPTGGKNFSFFFCFPPRSWQVDLANTNEVKHEVHRVWLVVVGINVDLAIFQPYLDLEAGDNQSLKIQSGEAGNRTSVLLLRKPEVHKENDHLKEKWQRY